jgi:ADP-heptose:LPS heptosyltransferase
MNVHIARFIDRWIGIPLCLALSLFNRLIPKKSRADIEIKKILFLELSEMGSAVLAYPAMKKMQEAYPRARLYFWIFKKNQDSVSVLDIIPRENVIAMRSQSLITLCIDIFKNLRRIHREKIDTVIDMELFSRFTSILTYLSRATTRAGFHECGLKGLYRGNLHTHNVTYNPRMHIGRNFLSLVSAVIDGGQKNKPPLKISATDASLAIARKESSQQARDKIWEKLKELNPCLTRQDTLVLVNPGINDILPVRRWPIENYTRLVKDILENEHIFIVLVGTASQSFYGEKISKGIISPRIINLIGKTNVEELLALCDISKLLISHDSGIVHLASLTKIHIIVLFGPETPALYAPLTPEKTVFYAGLSCSPCICAYNHRRSVCRDNRCLKAITVEEVLGAAKKVLQ